MVPAVVISAIVTLAIRSQRPPLPPQVYTPATDVPSNNPAAAVGRRTDGRQSPRRPDRSVGTSDLGARQRRADSVVTDASGALSPAQPIALPQAQPIALRQPQPTIVATNAPKKPTTDSPT